MTNITVSMKDEIVMKILHYFVTKENYRPIIVSGVQNEIWLENLDKDISLIRININYIHNNEQLKTDMRKCEAIRKSIKKKTYKLNLNMLNLLVDVRDEVSLISDKCIESIKIDKVSDLKKNDIFNTFFPKFKESVSGKKAGVMGMLQMTEELNEKTKTEEKKLSKVFRNIKAPIITYALIIINILIYIISLFNQNFFIYYFANKFEFVQNGEIYRLITSMFLHANILHLLFNMYALYMLGPQIEKLYGKFKYLLIYLGSGLFGSLFSVITNNSFGIGASGAIFGLFGALIYFGLKYRATLDGFIRSGIIPVLIINLIIGLVYQSIDLSAHIGGLLGGMLLSYTLCVPNKENKSDRINGIIISVISLIALFYILMLK